MNDCACQQTTAVEFDQVFIRLGELRQKCPVLGKLLIPDGIWEQFKNFEQSPRDEALHTSILIVSLLNGDLGRATSPCHKYLFDGDHIKAQVTKQYRQDLQEHWMFEPDEVERHRKSKMFQARIVELQIAEWLENQNWQIASIEALGASADIEGIRPLSHDAAVEVKFIGQRDEEFEQVVKALTGLPAGGVGPTHLACNYLIFRVYEAAFKIRQMTERRIAVVVIDDLAWTFFHLPLRYGWIDWKRSVFFDVGEEWNSFLQDKKQRYPNIDSDIAGTINSLDELWIVVRRNGHTYSMCFHYSFQ